jgi:hypothetical protein
MSVVGVRQCVRYWQMGEVLQLRDDSKEQGNTVAPARRRLTSSPSSTLTGLARVPLGPAKLGLGEETHAGGVLRLSDCMVSCASEMSAGEE